MLNLRAVALALVAPLAACAAAQNYEDTDGPRYAGEFAPQALTETPTEAPKTLRVVSFNIKFSEAIKRANRLLQENPELKDADVLLLQEMDAEGTAELAEMLSMNYVYYPAVMHVKTDRDFGNAVLSRWPIVDDQKLILPYQARFDKSQRIATRARISLGERELDVYSVHLATPIELGEGSRRAQARAIREDAKINERAIIGGDFNDKDVVQKVFGREGFTWPTQNIGKTNRWSSVDHLVAWQTPFIDGGVVQNNRAASDHKPVWATFDLAP